MGAARSETTAAHCGDAAVATFQELVCHRGMASITVENAEYSYPEGVLLKSMVHIRTLMILSRLISRLYQTAFALTSPLPRFMTFAFVLRPNCLS